jgi:hypothetical protein
LKNLVERYSAITAALNLKQRTTSRKKAALLSSVTWIMALLVVIPNWFILKAPKPSDLEVVS